MFCPTCGSVFQEHPLLDPNLRGYGCAAGHVFHTTVVEQIGGIPEAQTIDPPPAGNDLDVLRFWLTNPLARQRLPNQLAVVCRRLLENNEGVRRVAAAADPFVFCPSCSAPLARFKSDDVYLQGLRCANGHDFWHRGSYVLYVDNGVNKNLSAELDDDFMPKLIEYYVSDDKWVRPYVHPQLREALQRLAP
jgi:hypothetical protein